MKQPIFLECHQLSSLSDVRGLSFLLQLYPLQRVEVQSPQLRSISIVFAGATEHVPAVAADGVALSFEWLHVSVAGLGEQAFPLVGVEFVGVEEEQAGTGIWVQDVASPNENFVFVEGRYVIRARWRV